MIKLLQQYRREAIVFAKILAPVIFLIFVGASFHEFVWNAVKANVAINCGIILAAAYGVVLIGMRLVGAMADFRVIERFGREAQQGVYMKTLLDEPWLKRRYVRHYLTHIANTGGTLASQMDQHAIESELHALQTEYDSKLELPQFLVGFMIAMGLLGTFIGLLSTLTGISSMLDGMGGSGSDVEAQFMKLVVELRKPLAGMGIAFSASMFGLITSLMLAVMMTNLRRYINRVMAVARNVMHDLTEMTRGSSSNSGTSRSLSPEDIAAMARETVPEAPMSTVSNTLLAGRFDLLSKKIELLLTAFEASNTGMQKMTDLLGFGPRMRDISERTLDELKGISAKGIEQQTLTRALIEAHAVSAQNAVAMLESHRQTKDVSQESLSALKNLTLGIAEQHQISRQLVEHEGSVIRLLGSLLESQKQAKDSGDRVAIEMSTLSGSMGEARRLTQNLVDAELAIGRGVDGIVDAQRQFREDIAGLVGGLAERIGKMEESSLGGARHLWEIKENFIKLCKSLGVVDLMASGISGQVMLLETLVEETRTSQRTLASLRADIQVSDKPGSGL